MHDVRYATFSEKGAGCNKNLDIKFSEYDHRHLFHSKNYAPSSSFPTSPQYFSLICDPFADPIISLHSRDISLFDCHI